MDNDPEVGYTATLEVPNHELPGGRETDARRRLRSRHLLHIRRVWRNGREVGPLEFVLSTWCNHRWRCDWLGGEVERQDAEKGTDNYGRSQNSSPATRGAPCVPRGVVGTTIAQDHGATEFFLGALATAA